MRMQKPLLPLFLLLLIAPVLSLKAQQDSLSKRSKVVIRSYQQDGSDKNEYIIERQLDSESDMGELVDSILQGLGLDLGSVKGLRKMGQSMQMFFENDSANLDSVFNLFRTFDFNGEGFFEGFESLDIPGNFDAFMAQRTPRPFLGIVFEDLVEDDAVADKKGVVITRVVQGSSAESAGLSAGDRILMIDEDEIVGISGIQQIVADHKVGDKIKVVFERDGRIMETLATLKPKSNNESAWLLTDREISIQGEAALPKCDKIIVQKAGPRLGISVTDPDNDARKALRVKSGGALVTKVERSSCAEKLGVQLNDVITSFNGQQVMSSVHLKELVAIQPIGAEFAMDLVRYGKKRSVKGVISEYTRSWDEQMPINIIDFSASEIQSLQDRLQEIELQLEEIKRNKRRR